MKIAPVFAAVVACAANPALAEPVKIYPAEVEPRTLEIAADTQVVSGGDTVTRFEAEFGASKTVMATGFAESRDGPGFGPRVEAYGVEGLLVLPRLAFLPFNWGVYGEYRAGARPHPTMKGQASSLSEQEARDLAAYFSTANPVKSGGKATGTPPAAAATCVACHGADGVGITADYPTLAGQQPDYIEQALAAYRKGTRQNAVMNGMAAQLKDEDIRELAEYFSQQSPSLWVPLPQAQQHARAP